MKEDSNHNTTSKEIERHNESRRLNEPRKISETIADEKEKKTSRMTENIIEDATSIEVFQLNLLQRSDETTELSNKVKTKKDYGNHLKLTSKVNQDERTRLPEIREKSATMIVTDNNKLICSSQTISCLKEDSKCITTYKEKERHDKSTWLNESRELSETITDDKEKKTLSMYDNITEQETSKEFFKTTLLQKSDAMTAVSTNLKSEIASSNKLTMLSKVIQDEKTGMNALREKSETVTVNANYKLRSSSQTIFCMKEEMNPKLKETFKKQCIQQIDEINSLRLKLNNETGSGTKQKIASK